MGIIEYINIFYILFAISLIIIYLLTGLLSIYEIKKYIDKNRYVDYKLILNYKYLPSISIIAPAFNESKTIVENINCLLSINYTDFEIIIVNDGSTDNSLEIILENFDMIKVNQAFESNLSCEPVNAIYKSRNSAYNQLVVIDKKNGGKADALNAGLNLSSKELFLALDVDCIIESDAILKMVKPFLDNSKQIVIAAGGVIRVANSCNVIDGKVTQVNFPKNIYAKFQVLEYIRAFMLSRMAWSRLNGLLIISGAFGLFDRKRVVKIGGYDRNTVGEDLELVVRLRKYMHDIEKKKYKVAFIPDPLCWTEVPESFKNLSGQRNRWTRGGIDTILKHKNMFFNPRYGTIGMLSFPYWVFFEWLAPIIEFFGLLYFITIFALGFVNIQVFLVMLTFLLAFSVMYSFFAIFLESYSFNKYKGTSFVIQISVIIIFEMIIYQPMIMIFSLFGNMDFFLKKNKKNWGKMTRKGFNNTES